jgi:CMP/dCMP kinase
LSALKNNICIAIDGPAGAGKSSLARQVAEELAYLYLDTGAMYRAATWIALEAGCDISDETEVESLIAGARIELIAGPERLKVLANGTDVSLAIRSPEVTRAVSTVAAMAAVRRLLVVKQQQIAAAGGVVMDGRDIGTVVLPGAELKIFLTASTEVRALRRLKDMKEMGQEACLETIIADIIKRDHIDSTRTNSPLKKADDAVLIDTDNDSLAEVCQKVLTLARQRIQSKSAQ